MSIAGLPRVTATVSADFFSCLLRSVGSVILARWRSDDVMAGQTAHFVSKRAFAASTERYVLHRVYAEKGETEDES